MKNYLLIIRPFNCLFIGLAILTGAWLNNSISDLFTLIIALISGVFIAAGGYVINDFYDLPIDVVNKPRRILPRGGIKPDYAYMYAMFLFVSGFSLSFFTGNMWAIIIAIVNSLLLYFYAKKLKKTILLSNLIISYTTGSAFLFGAVINANVMNILPIFIYTFLYTLVREIVKDAEDEMGDRKVGIITLATVFGEKKTVLFSLIPALILALTLYLSYREELITEKFFTTIFLLYIIPLIIIYFNLFLKITTSKLRETSGFMKLHMLLLLVVLFIIS